MKLKSLTQEFLHMVVDNGLKYDFIKFVSIFMVLVRGDNVFKMFYETVVWLCFYLLRYLFYKY